MIMLMILLYHVIQGMEGATAAAQALSLPAEAYGNDVS